MGTRGLDCRAGRDLGRHLGVAGTSAEDLSTSENEMWRHFLILGLDALVWIERKLRYSVNSA